MPRLRLGIPSWRLRRTNDDKLGFCLARTAPSWFQRSALTDSQRRNKQKHVIQQKQKECAERMSFDTCRAERWHEGIFTTQMTGKKTSERVGYSLRVTLLRRKCEGAGFPRFGEKFQTPVALTFWQRAEDFGLVIKSGEIAVIAET